MHSREHLHFNTAEAGQCRVFNPPSGHLHPGQGYTPGPVATCVAVHWTARQVEIYAGMLPYGGYQPGVPCCWAVVRSAAEYHGGRCLIPCTSEYPGETFTELVDMHDRHNSTFMTFNIWECSVQLRFLLIWACLIWAKSNVSISWDVPAYDVINKTPSRQKNTLWKYVFNWNTALSYQTQDLFIVSKYNIIGWINSPWKNWDCQQTMWKLFSSKQGDSLYWLYNGISIATYRQYNSYHMHSANQWLWYRYWNGFITNQWLWYRYTFSTSQAFPQLHGH